MTQEKKLFFTWAISGISMLLVIGFLLYVYSDKRLKHIASLVYDDWVHQPNASLVLLGSSTAKRFPLDLLEGCGPVLNRGIGAAVLDEISLYLRFGRLPKSLQHVIIYAGENDLGVRKPLEQTLEDFRKLVDNLADSHPGAILHILPVKPSPRRVRERERHDIIVLNQQRQQVFQSVGPNVRFYPLHEKFISAAETLFLEDGIHLNDRGYELLGAPLKLDCRVTSKQN